MAKTKRTCMFCEYEPDWEDDMACSGGTFAGGCKYPVPEHMVIDCIYIRELTLGENAVKNCPVWVEKITINQEAGMKDIKRPTERKSDYLEFITKKHEDDKAKKQDGPEPFLPYRDLYVDGNFKKDGEP